MVLAKYGKVALNLATPGFGLKSLVHCILQCAAAAKCLVIAGNDEESEREELIQLEFGSQQVIL